MRGKLNCNGAWIPFYPFLNSQRTYTAYMLWKPFVDDFRESIWRKLELY